MTTQTENVSRLIDIETEEVSIVDRAANKRRFLVVKSDGNENAAGSEGLVLPSGLAAPSTPVEAAKVEAVAALVETPIVAAPVEPLVAVAPPVAEVPIVPISIEPHVEALESLMKAISVGKVDLGGVAEKVIGFVAEVTKGMKVVEGGAKGWKLVDSEGKVVGEFENEFMARAAMRREMASKSEAEAPKAAEVPVTEAVEKVGSPMQGDRLTRLKSALSLFREALSDLKSGSTNLEKFVKVGKTLTSIIAELQIRKSAGVMDQNVGIGRQPDEATVSTAAEVAPGPGVSPELKPMLELEELKKSSEAQAGEILKRDEEISILKREIARLRRVRSAPSAGSAELAKVHKSESDAAVWPRDMARADR